MRPSGSETATRATAPQSRVPLGLARKVSDPAHLPERVPPRVVVALDARLEQLGVRRRAAALSVQHSRTRPALRGTAVGYHLDGDAPEQVRLVVPSSVLARRADRELGDGAGCRPRRRKASGRRGERERRSACSLPTARRARNRPAPRSGIAVGVDHGDPISSTRTSRRDAEPRNRAASSTGEARPRSFGAPRARLPWARRSRSTTRPRRTRTPARAIDDDAERIAPPSGRCCVTRFDARSTTASR